MASNRTSIARTSTHISGPNRRERRNGMDIDRTQSDLPPYADGVCVECVHAALAEKSSRNDYCERRKSLPAH